MKKFNLFFCSIALIFLLASCQSDKDGLSLDSFKTSAIVQGNVYYSLGQDFLDNKYIVDKRLNAEGKKIYLDIPNSEFKPGALGVITYEAVLDASGNYSFSIPVKAQGNTAATIRLEQFLAKRQVFNAMNAGVPQFVSEDAVFSYSKSISISKGNLMFLNISYNFTPVNLPNNYNEYITFNGTLKLAYEKAFRDGALKSANGSNVEVAVTYPNLGTLHFGTTVDQNGNYSIKIPVATRKNAITATFTPVSYVIGDYTHYTSSSSQVALSGIYSVASAITRTTQQGLSEDINYDLGSSTLFFEPFTNPATWVPDNLAGWVQLDPSIYRYSITLTGGVMFGYEKSYLSGDYNASIGKTVTVNVNMGASYGIKTYILATDNNGKFTLPLMLPDRNINLAVSVEVETYGVTNYKHYLSDGSSLTLNGWYNQNYFNIANKTISVNEFNSVYALDNLYQLFTPLEENVKDWNNNLIGWYQIAGKKSSVIISGAVKKAVEGAPDKAKPSAWAVAAWANAANQPFSITISGQTFIGITNATGQYNLTYPLTVVLDPMANNNLTIAVSSNVAKFSTFNHYDNINATTPTQQVQGSYSGSLASSVCTIVDGTTCTVKDCYMFFTPTIPPTAWSNYTWVIN